jgi:uncharacterized membrane protein (UPF0127 family)
VIAVNRTREKILGDRIRSAESFLSRARGLIGRKSLADGEGLWIAPCRSVHTFFMSFPIDVIFLDSEGVVIALHPDLRPSRISSYYRNAAGVLELPHGIIQATGTERGDFVEFLEGT